MDPTPRTLFRNNDVIETKTERNQLSEISNNHANNQNYPSSNLNTDSKTSSKWSDVSTSPPGTVSELKNRFVALEKENINRRQSFKNVNANKPPLMQSTRPLMNRLPAKPTNKITDVHNKISKPTPQSESPMSTTPSKRIVNIPMNKVNEMKKILFDYERSAGVTSSAQYNNMTSKQRAVIEERLNRVSDIRKWLNELEQSSSSSNTASKNRAVNLPMNRVNEMKHWLIDLEKHNKEVAERSRSKGLLGINVPTVEKRSRESLINDGESVTDANTTIELEDGRIIIENKEMPAVSDLAQWLVDFELKNKEHYQRSQKKEKLTAKFPADEIDESELESCIEPVEYLRMNMSKPPVSSPQRDVNISMIPIVDNDLYNDWSYDENEYEREEEQKEEDEDDDFHFSVDENEFDQSSTAISTATDQTDDFGFAVVKNSNMTNVNISMAPIAPDEDELSEDNFGFSPISQTDSWENSIKVNHQKVVDEDEGMISYDEKSEKDRNDDDISFDGVGDDDVRNYIENLGDIEDKELGYVETENDVNERLNEVAGEIAEYNINDISRYTNYSVDNLVVNCAAPDPPNVIFETHANPSIIQTVHGNNNHEDSLISFESSPAQIDNESNPTNTACVDDINHVDLDDTVEGDDITHEDGIKLELPKYEPKAEPKVEPKIELTRTVDNSESEKEPIICENEKKKSRSRVRRWLKSFKKLFANSKSKQIETETNDSPKYSTLNEIDAEERKGFIFRCENGLTVVTEGTYRDSLGTDHGDKRGSLTFSPDSVHGQTYLPNDFNVHRNGQDKGYHDIVPYSSCDSPMSLASAFAKTLSPASSTNGSPVQTSCRALIVRSSANVSQHVGFLKEVFMPPLPLPKSKFSPKQLGYF